MKELGVVATTLLLVIAISLFIRHLDPQAERNKQQAVKSVIDLRKPDVVVRNLELFKTDDQGFHKYHIQADELRHYVDQTTELQNLRLLVDSPDTPMWFIQSQNGWLDQDGERMLLLGSVYINRHDRSTEQRATPLSGFTHNLLIDYTNSLAWSPSPTTLLDGNSVLSGQGLDISFADPTHIRLLSRVTGTHAID